MSLSEPQRGWTSSSLVFWSVTKVASFHRARAAGNHWPQAAGLQDESVPLQALPALKSAEMVQYGFPECNLLCPLLRRAAFPAL